MLGVQGPVSDVTVLVLHLIAAPPPLYPGRPASIPPSVTTNDAANNPALLSDYREAAARQLHVSRQSSQGSENESIALEALKTQMETQSRDAIPTPDTMEVQQVGAWRSRLPVESVFGGEAAIITGEIASHAQDASTRYSPTLIHSNLLQPILAHGSRQHAVSGMRDDEAVCATWA